MVIEICRSEYDVYCMPVGRKEHERPAGLYQCGSNNAFNEESVKWPLYSLSVSWIASQL